MDKLPNYTEALGEHNVESVESVGGKTLCHVSVTKKM